MKRITLVETTRKNTVKSIEKNETLKPYLDKISENIQSSIESCHFNTTVILDTEQFNNDNSNDSNNAISIYDLEKEESAAKSIY